MGLFSWFFGEPSKDELAVKAAVQKGRAGQDAKAKAQFELSIKKEASNPGAWYYLALIARTNGDNQTALSNLMKAIQISPTFKPAYELSAQIYESQGDGANAQRFRAAMAQMK